MAFIDALYLTLEHHSPSLTVNGSVCSEVLVEENADAFQKASEELAEKEEAGDELLIVNGCMGTLFVCILPAHGGCFLRHATLQTC